MRHSISKGFGFGLTSGVITTMGLMVGLNSGTHLTSVVIAGILIIAIADALSDALGMHISEESEDRHNPGEIWMATLVTFLSKLVVASSFIIPVLIFPLSTAIIISIAWGLLLIVSFSWIMAKKQNKNILRITLEHLIIAIIVIAATHYIGGWVAKFD